jgi:acyl-[acyl-carrier-protein]-phospholipid O-acyltransferase/long-chain-fatty-acid--[acyl-carrier-protein] ligase
MEWELYNMRTDRSELMASGKAAGLGEIMIPRTILEIEALPVMGTGKIDYVQISAFVHVELGLAK